MTTTKRWNLPRPDGRSGLQQDYYNVSEVSPRTPDGKLILQSNAHSFANSVVTQYKPHYHPQCPALELQGAGGRPIFGVTDAMLNEVRAKFMGRLKYGDVDLGMTFASWRQSADMITSRSRKMFKIFTEVGNRKTRRYRGSVPRVERRADPTTTLANDVLEGEFGWVPLIADIRGTALTAFAHAIPSTLTSATAKWPFQELSPPGSSFSGTEWIKSGHARATFTSKVQISNPNTWILNRLGLINPLTVAWDRVPWSFVVNMFVNTNQLINALTDTVGLTLTSGSMTRTSVCSKSFKTWTHYTPYSYVDGVPVFGRLTKAEASETVLCRYKSRQAETLPTPTLQFRVPDVNLELAVIASSLVTQKVGGMFATHYKPVRRFVT